MKDQSAQSPVPVAIEISPPVTPAPTAQRLSSLDAFRGFVMLLLVFLDRPNGGWSEEIIKAHTDTPWVAAVLNQFEHVQWAGLVLWDMIQPSFMFMVGAAAAYSYASRARRGHSFWRMFGHAVYRAVVLILLGVFLRSKFTPGTNWTFEDVVSQIGLGYVFVFLLWNRGWKIQLAAALAILLGYWMLFAFWPPPPADYDYAAVHGKAFYEGFQAHWNKNAHPALYFDQWFLNLFPRQSPYVGHPGGYMTLNFIPSLATMIFGLMAGAQLRGDHSQRRKLLTLLPGGALAMAAGAAMHYAGICPIVKRIWTPSFALFSGGICLITLGLLYALMDIAGWRRWAFPAVVVGANSIAAYALIHLTGEWVVATVRHHFGDTPYNFLGAEYQPLLENLSVGIFVWLICLWMYRRHIHVRI